MYIAYCFLHSLLFRRCHGWCLRPSKKKKKHSIWVEWTSRCQSLRGRGQTDLIFTIMNVRLPNLILDHRSICWHAVSPPRWQYQIRVASHTHSSSDWSQIDSNKIVKSVATSPHIGHKIHPSKCKTHCGIFYKTACTQKGSVRAVVLGC